MAENQFGAEDSEGFKDLARDQARLLEVSVVILRTTAYTGTAAALHDGIAKGRTIVPIEASFGMRVMTGKDILSAGGLYKLGDLECTSTQYIQAADNINQIEADKMIWNKTEYTLQGDVQPIPGGGGFTYYKHHWRRA